MEEPIYQSLHTKIGKLKDTPMGIELWSNEGDNIATNSKDDPEFVLWRKQMNNIDLLAGWQN